MRSPTRLEVDSSVYLESPDEPPPQPQQQEYTVRPRYSNTFLKYLLLVILTNTVIFLIKNKIQKDGVEDILLFLGLCNVAMALLYMVTPVVYLLSTWTWSALTKHRETGLTPIGRIENRGVAEAPTTPPVPTPEAPPPPYHIAVNSTPPPSYFSIFPK